jgi:hypothetical protein
MYGKQLIKSSIWNLPGIYKHPATGKMLLYSDVDVDHARINTYVSCIW